MIQDTCKVLGDSGCNLFSYYVCLGLDPADVLKDYDSLVKDKLILSDCTIKDYNGLAKLKGKFVDVQWAYPKDYIQDTPYIGRWERVNDKGEKIHHFVAMKNGKIIFNSMDTSRCVNEGYLVDIRRIEWK